MQLRSRRRASIASGLSMLMESKHTDWGKVYVATHDSVVVIHTEVAAATAACRACRAR